MIIIIIIVTQVRSHSTEGIKIGRFHLACSAGSFGGFHLSSVKPPFWICWRLGEDWGENVGGGFYLAPTLHCFSNSRWRPEQLMGISTRSSRRNPPALQARFHSENASNVFRPHYARGI